MQIYCIKIILYILQYVKEENIKKIGWCLRFTFNYILKRLWDKIIINSLDKLLEVFNKVI